MVVVATVDFVEAAVGFAAIVVVAVVATVDFAVAAVGFAAIADFEVVVDSAAIVAAAAGSVEVVGLQVDFVVHLVDSVEG